VVGAGEVLGNEHRKLEPDMEKGDDDHGSVCRSPKLRLLMSLSPASR
jgi:hypothetical protein